MILKGVILSRVPTNLLRAAGLSQSETIRAVRPFRGEGSACCPDKSSLPHPAQVSPSEVSDTRSSSVN